MSEAEDKNKQFNNNYLHRKLKVFSDIKWVGYHPQGSLMYVEIPP